MQLEDENAWSDDVRADGRGTGAQTEEATTDEGDRELLERSQ